MLIELARLESENEKLRAAVAGNDAEHQARKRKVAESYAAYEARFFDNDGLTANTSAALRWQGLASSVMMFLTFIMAFAGILFSGFQLWTATATAAKALVKAAEVSKPHPGEPRDGDVFGFSVKASEFQLRTSAIGLAVLVISCVYLHYFYVNVYKIDFGTCQAKEGTAQASPIGPDRSPAAPEKAAAQKGSP